MNLVLYASMFMLGLGGSLHCLGMCGPLVMAVPFPKSRQNLLSKTLYFLGKALAYGILGAVISLFGLKALWGDSQRYISILAGIIVILLAIFPILQPKIGKFPFRNSFQNIFKAIKENPKWHHFLRLGFINGLLPCGMVYMALAAAMTGGGLVEGFIAMLFFGIGTTPLLWILASVKSKITTALRQQLKPVTIGLSLLVGILLLLRGLNLGIPYISPKLDTSMEMEHHHHHH